MVIGSRPRSLRPDLNGSGRQNAGDLDPIHRVRLLAWPGVKRVEPEISPDRPVRLHHTPTLSSAQPLGQPVRRSGKNRLCRGRAARGGVKVHRQPRPTHHHCVKNQAQFHHNTPYCLTTDNSMGGRPWQMQGRLAKIGAALPDIWPQCRVTVVRPVARCCAGCAGRQAKQGAAGLHPIAAARRVSSWGSSVCPHGARRPFAGLRGRVRCWHRWCCPHRRPLACRWIFA